MESEKCLHLHSYNLSPWLCDTPFIQNSRCSNHVKCHTAFLHSMKGSYTSRMSVQRRRAASATLSDQTENTLCLLGPNRQYLNPASHVSLLLGVMPILDSRKSKMRNGQRIQREKVSFSFPVTWSPWRMMFCILDYSTIYSMRYFMPYILDHSKIIFIRPNSWWAALK